MYNKSYKTQVLRAYQERTERDFICLILHLHLQPKNPIPPPKLKPRTSHREATQQHLSHTRIQSIPAIFPPHRPQEFDSLYIYTPYSRGLASTKGLTAHSSKPIATGFPRRGKWNARRIACR